MILPELTFSLAQLSVSLRKYGEVSGRTENEVLAKHSSELAWNIYHGMKSIAPGKGAVMAEGLAALKAGRGIHVRASVLADIAGKYNATTSLATGQTYLAVRKGRKVVAMATTIEQGGKQLDLQALAVQRELNIRESARGFSAVAVPRPPRGLDANNVRSLIAQDNSRYGFQLSQFELNMGVEQKFAMISWLGRSNESYESAVEGLKTAKQQKILAEAVAATRANIETYLARKLGEDKAKAGLN